MTLAEFKETVGRLNKAPEHLPPTLQALWHDAKGDWDGAHQIAQDIDTSEGAWVHAYLHRKEGDLSNASYWYRRAGRPESLDDLDQEWGNISQALLRWHQLDV